MIKNFLFLLSSMAFLFNFHSLSGWGNFVYENLPRGLKILHDLYDAQTVSLGAKIAGYWLQVKFPVILFLSLLVLISQNKGFWLNPLKMFRHYFRLNSPPYLGHKRSLVFSWNGASGLYSICHLHVDTCACACICSPSLFYNCLMPQNILQACIKHNAFLDYPPKNNLRLIFSS